MSPCRPPGWECTPSTGIDALGRGPRSHCSSDVPAQADPAEGSWALLGPLEMRGLFRSPNDQRAPWHLKAGGQECYEQDSPGSRNWPSQGQRCLMPSQGLFLLRDLPCTPPSTPKSHSSSSSALTRVPSYVPLCPQPPTSEVSPRAVGSALGQRLLQV